MKKTICEAKIKVTRYWLLIIMAIIDLFFITVFKDKLIEQGNSLAKVIIILSLIILLPAVIITLSNIYSSKRCKLKLNQSGVCGVRKTLFSSSELNLPIDKIDSIMIL